MKNLRISSQNSSQNKGILLRQQTPLSTFIFLVIMWPRANLWGHTPLVPLETGALRTKLSK
jgi:hypothetical protein